MRIVKKILKILSWSIVILIAIIIIADIGFYYWLKANPRKVEEFVRTNAGSKVEIGEVRGEFFFGFKIKDIIIFPSDDPTEQRLLRAGEIDVDLSLPSLLKLKPYPSTVTMDDFDAVFTIDEDGKFVLPTFSTAQAQGGEASGPLDMPCNVDVTLTRGSIEFHWHAGGVAPVQAMIREVEGEGEFNADGRIIISSFVGMPMFAKRQMQVSGHIDPYDAKDIDLKLSGESVNLLEISEMLKPIFRGAPSDILPRGDANCKVNIQGPFDAISVNGDISLTAGRLANLQLGASELFFEYKGEALTLKDCTAKAYGGLINLDTEIRFDQPRSPFSFDIDFAGVDVNSYIEQIGLYFSEATGDFHGHFEGRGELERSAALVAMGNFESNGGTYRSPFLTKETTYVERLDYDALRVDFEASEGVISIVNLLLESDELVVVARGTVDMKRQLDLRGQMSFPRERALLIPSIRQWLGILKAIDGQLILDFSLVGELSKPKFSAKSPGKILDLFYDAELDILDWFSGISGIPVPG